MSSEPASWGSGVSNAMPPNSSACRDSVFTRMPSGPIERSIPLAVQKRVLLRTSRSKGGFTNAWISTLL